MSKSILKTALVVGAIALLSTESVDAQIQITQLPRRLEDALINPNLREVLRNNVRVASLPYTATAPSRVTPQLASPIYSNEPSRFSPIEPEIADREPIPAKLPTLEEIDTPPGFDQEPVEASFGDEVISVPPPTRSKPAIPVPVVTPAKVSPEPKLSKNLDIEKPLAPIKGQLKFRVTGASAMIESQPADLLIEVYNPTSHAIGPIEVNVRVPDELTITRFDRDAWLDSDNRVIAFNLDQIQAGMVEKIGMKGVSHSAGTTDLSVALLSGETTVAQRTVKSQVFPQQLAQQHSFGDEESTDTIKQ